MPSVVAPLSAAAVLETATAILVRPAGRLDDPIQGQTHEHNDLAHSCLLDLARHRAASSTSTRTASGQIDTSSSPRLSGVASKKERRDRRGPAYRRCPSSRHDPASAQRKQASDVDRDDPGGPSQGGHRCEAECPGTHEQNHGQDGRDELKSTRLPHRRIQESGEGDERTEYVQGGSGNRLPRLTKPDGSQEQHDAQADDDPILPTPPCSHGSNLLGTTSDLGNAVGAPSGGPQSRHSRGAAQHRSRYVAANAVNLLRKSTTTTCASNDIFRARRGQRPATRCLNGQVVTWSSTMPTDCSSE